MKQRIVHGATIDAATTEEVATLIRESSRASLIAYGGGPIQKELKDWPVKGHDRIVSPGRAHGSANLVLAANTYTDILDTDMGRAGLSLINIGGAACFVYLADANHAQNDGNAATGYIAPGGSWDGKVSDAFWVGPVSVMSVVGTVLVMAVL